MIICDENNTCYQVNDKEALIATVDNDILLDILKHSHLNLVMNKNIQSLVKNGILIAKDDENNSDKILEMEEGVAFLSEVLSEKLTPEVVNEILALVPKFDYNCIPKQIHMQREIERKFLVTNTDFLLEEGIADKIEIMQGYISKVDGKIVRVRRTNSLLHESVHGKLTLKVKNAGDNDAGVDEFEYDIPEDEAAKLLHNCEEPIIEKIRYVIEYGNTLWEVDVFHGHKLGLVIAEVELKNENDHIDMPLWIGEEVTGKAEYYNANM